jgi:hydrogenase maturation protease
VDVIARHVLTAELAPNIAAADRVIFLDAAADCDPGEVRCRPLAPEHSAVSAMAHFLDPRELLVWCQTLYNRLPECLLVTVGGEHFDFASYKLSPAAELAAEAMTRKVRELLSMS